DRDVAAGRLRDRHGDRGRLPGDGLRHGTRLPIINATSGQRRDGEKRDHNARVGLAPGLSPGMFDQLHFFTRASRSNAVASFLWSLGKLTALLNRRNVIASDVIVNGELRRKSGAAC